MNERKYLLPIEFTAAAMKEGYWQDLPVEEGYEWIEFLAQLSNSKPEFTEKFSLETVEAFLEERRKMWYM